MNVHELKQRAVTVLKNQKMPARTINAAVFSTKSEANSELRQKAKGRAMALLIAEGFRPQEVEAALSPIDNAEYANSRLEDFVPREKAKAALRRTASGRDEGKLIHKLWREADAHR